MSFFLKIFDFVPVHGGGTLVIGRVLEGEISKNEKVVILRENKSNLVTDVSGINKFNASIDRLERKELMKLLVLASPVNKAIAGDNVGVTLNTIEKNDIEKGDCLVDYPTHNNVSSDKAMDDTFLSPHQRRTIVILPNGANNVSFVINDIPKYTISKSTELFKFPPNHPVANTAYAMADVFPDYYIPINGFHEYFKQTKHASFVELCANLGAKEICIENIEINDKVLDINGDITTPLYNLGLGISIKNNNETDQRIAFKFSEENRL